jgi:hypothetical protein
MARQTPVTIAHRSTRTPFQRQLALIAVVGTVLPLAVLALMFLLAPLPMAPATADVLRNASRFAGAIVLIHWSITLAVWAASKAVKPATARQSDWQGIKLVRNANA